MKKLVMLLLVLLCAAPVFSQTVDTLAVASKKECIYSFTTKENNLYYLHAKDINSDNYIKVCFGHKDLASQMLNNIMNSDCNTQFIKNGDILYRDVDYFGNQFICIRGSKYIIICKADDEVKVQNALKNKNSHIKLGSLRRKTIRKTYEYINN